LAVEKVNQAYLFPTHPVPMAEIFFNFKRADATPKYAHDYVNLKQHTFCNRPIYTFCEHNAVSFKL